MQNVNQGGSGQPSLTDLEKTHCRSWPLGLSAAFLLAFVFSSRASEAASLPTSCVQFKWLGTKALPKSAINVPVEIDGQAHYFQLDTGTPSTELYVGAEVKARTKLDQAEAGFGHRAVTSVRLAGAHLPVTSLSLDPGMTPDASTDGTLGLRGLLGHIVSIDYPGRKICLYAANARPNWPNRVHWTPAELDHGHLLITGQLGNREANHLIFDTGSSPITVAVDKSLWSKLTGQSPKQGSVAYRGTAWGKPIVGIDAMSKVPISIGGLRLQPPEVIIWPEALTPLSKFPGYVDGVVGNRSFLDAEIILDLGAKPRFGTMSSRKSPH